MSRDRLAPRRAAAAQETPQPVELSSFGPPSRTSQGTTLNDPADGEQLTLFQTEVSVIEEKLHEYRKSIAEVSDLRNHSLGLTNDVQMQNDSARVAEAQQQAFALSTEIKRRIQGLLSQSHRASPEAATAQRLHVERLQTKFKEAIQDFQTSESASRSKYKQRVERQFKIVKPNATVEEVQAVVEDPAGGGQIFSNAMVSSVRYGESRAAYREVQDRQQDIQRIEHTLTELAQLFSDMSILVSADDDKVNAAEQQAERAHIDLEQGDQHVTAAVRHAQAARKKRIICFIISLLITLGVAGAIAGIVYSQVHH